MWDIGGCDVAPQLYSPLSPFKTPSFPPSVPVPGAGATRTAPCRSVPQLCAAAPNRSAAPGPPYKEVGGHLHMNTGDYRESWPRGGASVTRGVSLKGAGRRDHLMRRADN